MWVGAWVGRQLRLRKGSKQANRCTHLHSSVTTNQVYHPSTLDTSSGQILLYDASAFCSPLYMLNSGAHAHNHNICKT